MNVKLVLTEKTHKQLYDHLYPGDGLEAVAICLCGRLKVGIHEKLLIHKVAPIPYSDCIRQEGYLKWSTNSIETLLKEAAEKNLAVLKIHSHPGGFSEFSDLDDKSDLELFQSVYGWTDTDAPHASAVMLPDGEIFARVISSDQRFIEIEKVFCIGDEIRIWNRKKSKSFDQFDVRNIQAFGEGTISHLKDLSIAVIGCSGTGSPVIEQLTRLGVNKLVLVDPDKIEEKNINRIINSTREQAIDGVNKVDALKNAIQSIGLGTEVMALPQNIYNSLDVINEVASCDIIFGCVDSVDGRHLLNLISTFYLIPYFDLGVKLIADGTGNVGQICGTVHYLKPGGSSLLTRQVYTYEDLRAASLFRVNASEYDNLKKSGYISNVNVDRPAVISVNMLIASLAVNEFLARIHKFRTESNDQYATTRFSLTDGYIQFEGEGDTDIYLAKFVGRGEMQPYLNLSELSQVVQPTI